jgi:hypothetical protein
MKKINLLIFYFSSLLANSQNSCNVSQLPNNLQNSLVAFYPFCGNANDVSVNGYNATTSNVTLTTDRFGNPNKAYSFNGVNSQISVNTSFFNPNWTDYSISAWFSSDNPNKLEQEILNTVPHNCLGIGYNYSGSWTGYCVYSLNSNPAVATWDLALGRKGSFQNYVPNQWYHVVLVKSGSVWKQYINGALEDTFTNTTVLTSTLIGLSFGASGSSVPSEFFSGKLDDYMIYNRALTSNEINTLYNATNVTTSLVKVSNLPNFRLYPNPTNNNFKIEGNPEDSNDYLVKIIDALGREVYQTVMDTNVSNEININSQKGLYFVEIMKMNKQLVFSTKLIID